MADRIPSSLKWLIEKRKRIHSEIIYIEKKVENLLHLQQIKLEKLRLDLKAIDHTLTLHEIQVNLEKIPSLTAYEKRGDLEYGEITRLIYRSLGEAPECGLTTEQLANAMALKANIQIDTQVQYRRLRRSIGNRLRNLRKTGAVTKERQNGLLLWRLAVQQ